MTTARPLGRRDDGDGEARRQRIHRGRYLRRYIDAEAAFNLHLRDNPRWGRR